MITLSALEEQILNNIDEATDTLLTPIDINRSINEITNTLHMTVAHKIVIGIMDKLNVAVGAAVTPEEAIANGIEIITSFQQRIVDDGTEENDEFHKIVLAICRELIKGIPDLLTMELIEDGEFEEPVPAPSTEESPEAPTE